MIKIQDNTIRDGMQQCNLNKSLVVKKKILKEIKTINISSIEVGMCTTNEDEYNIKQFEKILNYNQEIVVLSRLKVNDLNRFISLNIRNKVIKLLIPTSKIHINQKLGYSDFHYKQQIKKCLKLLNEKDITIDICLEDATRTEINKLNEYIKLMSNYKIRTVTIADTVSCMVPKEYGSIFKFLTDRYPKIIFSAHCHNDLGLATANALEAINSGAKQVETTFLGIGERAGNTPIEELIMIFNKKYKNHININAHKFLYVSKRISEILNYKIPDNKPIIGNNIFTHESGIHQDGIIKNIEMYQYILPEDYGVPNNQLLKLPLSSLSSYKLLLKKFESLEFSGSIDDNINFYRLINILQIYFQKKVLIFIEF